MSGRITLDGGIFTWADGRGPYQGVRTIALDRRKYYWPHLAAKDVAFVLDYSGSMAVKCDGECTVAILHVA